MSLKKKLNIVSICLCVLLIIVLFLPSYMDTQYEISSSYWGEGPDHIDGIFYLVEFIFAIAILVIYQFDKLKDGNITLLFLGEFLANNIRLFYYLISNQIPNGKFLFGYWLGLLSILGVVGITIASNFIKEKPKNNMNNQFNNQAYGPYNNVYQQPNAMYGNQANNNTPPMGYNNYR